MKRIFETYRFKSSNVWFVLLIGLMSALILIPLYHKANQNLGGSKTCEVFPVEDTLKNKKQNNPQIDIKVDKEYDENGNIIRYDSTYTYIYRTPGGEQELNVDSIFNQFQPFFFDHYHDIFDHSFESFFEMDSLYPHDFFKDDFFYERYRKDLYDFGEMFHKFDSIKRNFLEKNYHYYHFDRNQGPSDKKKDKNIKQL